MCMHTLCIHTLLSSPCSRYLCGDQSPIVTQQSGQDIENSGAQWTGAQWMPSWYAFCFRKPLRSGPTAQVRYPEANFTVTMWMWSPSEVSKPRRANPFPPRDKYEKCSLGTHISHICGFCRSLTAEGFVTFQQLDLSWGCPTAKLANSNMNR